MKERSKNSGNPEANGISAQTLPAALDISRGVGRLFDDHGLCTLFEFPLGNGRRADVVGLDRNSRFTIVEVKSSRTDFRSDTKWPEYGPFCDFFYFAVGPDFPLSALPGEVGLIRADGYEGAIVRAARENPLNAARRKALLLRFARIAAIRLQRRISDGVGAATPEEQMPGRRARRSPR